MDNLLQQLDNPIWHALTSVQQDVSEGTAQARRYRYDIGPLAGIPSQTAESYAELVRLTRPDELMVLFLEEPPVIGPEWTLKIGGQLTQLLCEVSMQETDRHEIEVLTEADVPAMLELTALTKPGPFRTGTHRLGRYIGIKQAGRLVAMAGERIHLNGLTEISAVCTHPDYQGRGYARALVTQVANHIQQRGEIPFLHTGLNNEGAIRVYESLGFRQRRLFHLAVLSCQLPVPNPG